MKKKNLVDKMDDCLKFCMSTDDTRPMLQGYCHYKNLKALVTTNGHCAAIIKSAYQEELADLIISPINCRLIKREYPKIEAVIPAKHTHEEKYTLEPRHFIKPSKRQVFNLYFCEDGQIKLDRPEKFLFALASHYLKPLCDGTTYIFRFTTPLNPVMINLSPENDFHDFMIVMPRRVD